MIYKTISIDTNRSYITTPIYAKQGDCNSRFIDIQFMCNGSAFSIPEKSTATFNVCRSDNAIKSFFGTISTNRQTVTVELNSWVLAVSGVAKCDVSVICDDKKLTSATFQLNVEPAVITDTDITDNESYDVLVELINDCNKTVSDATTATINANTAVERVNETIDNATSATAAAVAATANANNIINKLSASQVSYKDKQDGTIGTNVQDAIDNILSIVASNVFEVQSWEDIYNVFCVLKIGTRYPIGSQFKTTVYYNGNKYDTYVRLVGIDQDIPVDEDLTHTATFEFVDVVQKEPFDSSGNREYEDSDIRQYLNVWDADTFLDMVYDIGEYICEVKKKTFRENHTICETNETVFLPSRSEIGMDSDASEGNVYTFYENATNYTRRKKSIDTDTYASWLTRSIAFYGVGGTVHGVSTSGSERFCYPTRDEGVSPMFCLGW